MNDPDLACHGSMTWQWQEDPITPKIISCPCKGNYVISNYDGTAQFSVTSNYARTAQFTGAMENI
jgi:hypothetical protein